MSPEDRRLGLDRPINRRDLLQGAAAAAIPRSAPTLTPDAPQQDRSGYNPPLLTGLRGSHPGSFEAAHALRDGDFWANPSPPSETDTPYDLIVVGGGISGLAAAHFFRAARPLASVLILDNHDDFGGHAKRNELHMAGRMHLTNGGTLEIDSPRPYSAVADGLLRTLGVYPRALEKGCAHKGFYETLGLSRGIFFDRETFGSDCLVSHVGKQPWTKLLADTPLSATVRADIVRIHEAHIDYMPGLSSAETKDRLSRISYADYLTKVAHADPAVLPFFQAMSHDEWGVGIDAVSALDVWSFDFPGFQGLKLVPGSAPRMGYTASGYADGSSYSFHFPDGNASIARLLVRNLVPAAISGHTAKDVVTAKVDYSRLDRPGNAVRIRLSSIVVGVRHEGDLGSARGVEVAYTRSNRVYRVRADACLLACYNMMIPFLCPELPPAQKQALHALVKIPLVYTTVGITNWRAFEQARIWTVYAPGSYHSTMHLNPVVDIGSYRSVRSPDDPILVTMVRVPCAPGLDERSQHRAGRAEMLATPFETFERAIRDQMGRTLGAAGFDPARDITSITVNRWPHGYSYEYNPLFDPQFAPGQAPHEIGRARFGRIAIANSDSGAAAYTDSAIDQAHRAVSELLAR
jgi:spermidine dehydrogenase